MYIKVHDCMASTLIAAFRGTRTLLRKFIAHQVLNDNYGFTILKKPHPHGI